MSGRKETVLDLAKFVDKGVQVKLTGGRHVTGTLKGGTAVMLVSPTDGTDEIAKPFSHRAARSAPPPQQRRSPCFVDDAKRSDQALTSTPSSDQDEGKNNNKRFGSVLQKQERSGTVDEDQQQQHWRSSKQGKSTTSSLVRTNSTGFDGQQFLSFSSSSPKSEAAQNASLPSYFQQAVSAYHRNSGNNIVGSLNGAAVHWTIAGGRRPFTPSQWMN